MLQRSGKPLPNHTLDSLAMVVEGVANGSIGAAARIGDLRGDGHWRLHFACNLYTLQKHGGWLPIFSTVGLMASLESGC